MKRLECFIWTLGAPPCLGTYHRIQVCWRKIFIYLGGTTITSASRTCCSIIFAGEGAEEATKWWAIFKADVSECEVDMTDLKVLSPYQCWHFSLRCTSRSMTVLSVQIAGQPAHPHFSSPTSNTRRSKYFQWDHRLSDCSGTLLNWRVNRS